MAKAAVASFNRIIRTCPKCKAGGPKELIQGRGDHLEAHCAGCGHTFNPHPSRFLIKAVFVILLLLVIVFIFTPNEKKTAPSEAAPETTEPAGPSPAEATAEKTAPAKPSEPKALRETRLKGPAADAAKKRALALYPEIGQAGTPMNKDFVARYERYLAERTEFFDQADWATALARESAEATGLKRVSE